MRAGVTALAMLAVLVCGTARAATPALRAGASNDEIEAWIAKNIDSATLIRAIDTNELTEFYDADAIEKLPNGHLATTFRAEFYRPYIEDGVTFRSTRWRGEVDCAANKYRNDADERFSDNNLRGRRTVGPAGEEWLSPDGDAEKGELLQICSLADVVGSPDATKALPPRLTDFSAAARVAWAAQHVDAGDDRYLGLEAGTLAYMSPHDVERLPGGVVRAWLRQELTGPVALGETLIRSMRTHLEADCSRNRYRNIDFIVFSGSNMLGKPSSDFIADGDPWQPARAGSDRARSLRAICRLAADASVASETAGAQAAVPAPASKSDTALVKWADTYLNTRGYVVAGFTDTGMSLYDYESLRALPNGNVTAAIRRENFAPDANGVRSVLSTEEFDCRGARIRLLEAKAFAETNLEVLLDAAPAGPWSRRLSEDSSGVQVLQQICAQRSLLTTDVDRHAAFIPAPSTMDEAEVAGWLKAYIQPKGYTYAGANENAVGLYSFEDSARTRRDHLRVWTRIEFFDPVAEGETVVRSARALKEYDCDEDRSRVLATETYPGSNLTGQASVERKSDSEWAFIEPRSLDSVFADTLCSLKDAADDSVSEPRLPQRESKTPL